MKVSICICAYNEEKNIGRLLERLSNQKLSDDFDLTEIVVVASGCTDKTLEVVRNFQLKNQKIKLFVQNKRKGKTSAINLFLKKTSGDILVLESADTLPLDNTIENLLEPFSNPKVGMVGGRPIPLNNSKKFTGFIVHMIWNLHHKISLKRPKMGELVAFRNFIKEMPKDTAVDEACIEALITQNGYELAYSPKAVVYNIGPKTISDLIRQRRRIYAGHMHLRKTMNYKPSTVNLTEVVKLVFDEIRTSPKNLHLIVMAIFLDIYARALAYFDYYIMGKNPVIWDVAESTKFLEGLS